MSDQTNRPDTSYVHTFGDVSQPDQFLNVAVEQVRRGRWIEVTVLAWLLQMPTIWLPYHHYFRSRAGGLYRYRGYTKAYLGEFNQLAGMNDPLIPIFESLDNFDDDTGVRNLLRSKLFAGELTEVTLIETYGSEELQLVNRIFRTDQLQFIELINPDGPSWGGWGPLGEVEWRQEPWKIASVKLPW